MTIDDRLTIDLADILSIQFECKKCHTTINYCLKGWEPSPLQCPNCKETRWGNFGTELQSAQSLAGSMRALLAHAENSAFCIRLQIENPSRPSVLRSLKDKPENTARG